MLLCVSAAGVKAHVCPPRLFAGLFVSRGWGAAEEDLPLPRHVAIETMPEIFNGEAAVDSKATLESMSHCQVTDGKAKEKPSVEMMEG